MSEEVFDVSVIGKSPYKGHEDWTTCVLWYPNLNRFVCSSLDSTIRIWKLDRWRSLFCLKFHFDQVQSLLKWNDTEFLSCGNYGKILLCSVKNGKLIRVVIPKITYEDTEDGEHSYNLKSMLKIREEIILVACFGRHRRGKYHIMMIDVRKGVILKRLTPTNLSDETKLLKSLKFDHCVFVMRVGKEDYGDDDGEEEHDVILLDYERDVILRTFVGAKRAIYSVSSYLHHKSRNEILISVGFDQKIFFFDTSANRDDDKNEISPFRVIDYESEDMFSEMCLITSSAIFKQRFLFIGDFDGDIRIFDLQNDFRRMEINGAKEINDSDSPIHHITFLESKDLPKGIIEVATGGRDHDVYVSKFKSDEFGKCVGYDFFEQERKDVMERVEYLLEMMKKRERIDFVFV